MLYEIIENQKDIINFQGKIINTQDEKISILKRQYKELEDFINANI